MGISYRVEKSLDNDESRFWPAKCKNCGWKGSSSLLTGGESLADTGDFDDVYCPQCDSDDLEEQ